MIKSRRTHRAVTVLTKLNIEFFAMEAFMKNRHLEFKYWSSGIFEVINNAFNIFMSCYILSFVMCRDIKVLCNLTSSFYLLSTIKTSSDLDHKALYVAFTTTDNIDE